ncbi:MAG: STAS domain-containing protein [Lysobacterales bacterium]
MALEIGSETHGDFRVLRLNGRLDTETSADFELAAHDLTQAGERRFVVDLGGISYVSSAGLRVLLALAKQVEGSGVVRLCSLAPSVRQVFDLSGFSKLFVIAPDLQAALRGDTVATAAATPNVARTAADLLGAGSSAPAARSSSSVGRQAADLLGAKPVAKPGFWARLLAWFKGQ